MSDAETPKHLAGKGAARVGGQRKTEGSKDVAGQVAGSATATSFAHYQDAGVGLELSPATVLTMSIVFIAVVVVLHIVGKFSGSRAPTA